MEPAQLAAIVAVVLIAGVTGFQPARAAGAPYGEAVLGGKAPTDAGVLTAPFRALAALQAVVLGMLGWVLLARTEVVATTPARAGSTGRPHLGDPVRPHAGDRRHRLRQR